MKRIITLTAIALGLSSGVALADRHSGGGRGEIRDHRGDSYRRPVVRQDNNRRWNGGNRGYRNNRVVVNRTRPVFRDNRFYFGANNYRVYHRPVINVRYRDYSRRPALIVENYDAVPGYAWIAGTWSWNGYEWMWVNGHYDVDQNYYDQGYDQGYDQQGYYDQSYKPAPVYNSGVTVQGHISF
ncbi:hypothetical protein BH11MYX3_BH11MYX3_18630 [soil metagenome]